MAGQPRSLFERTRIVGLAERRQRARDAALGYGEPYDSSDLDDPVFVLDGALERGAVVSYHVRSGCCGARQPVERSRAENAGATPCDHCLVDAEEVPADA